MERMEKIRFLATMAIVVGLYMAAVPAVTTNSSALSNFDYDRYGGFDELAGEYVDWDRVVKDYGVAARVYLFRSDNDRYINIFTRLYDTNSQNRETEYLHIKHGTYDGECHNNGLAWSKNGVSNRYPMDNGDGYDGVIVDKNGLGYTQSDYVNMHNENWRHSYYWTAYSSVTNNDKWNLHHKWATDTYGGVETDYYPGSHQGATFYDADGDTDGQYNDEYWVIIENWKISEDEWWGGGDTDKDEISWAYEGILE